MDGNSIWLGLLFYLKVRSNPSFSVRFTRNLQKFPAKCTEILFQTYDCFDQRVNENFRLTPKSELVTGYDAADTSGVFF